MSEFKAQILGVLLVLGVFGVLLTAYKTFVQSTVNQVTDKTAEVIDSAN